MNLFFAIFCMLTVYSAGILVFTLGFLLKRIVVFKNSTCILNDQSPAALEDLHGFLNVNYPSAHNETDACWMPRRYRRAVVVVIDALRFDFVFYNRSIDVEKEKPFENKLLSVKTALEKTPQNARLYRFVADPPTTTLQRLKGLTTGSLPTFVDAGANFASPEITEDNFIDHLVRLDRNITFMGDDTWEGLFPKRFRKSFPYPSFNVKDLDTVDNGIMQHLLPEYRQNDWTLLIAHFLGVDHCGHTFGPFHQRMTEKLTQMDTVLRSLMEEMTDDTILFVFGDHGMTKTGDHGGDSKEEVDAALFVFSPQPITESLVPAAGFKTLSQIDFVPTLSLLLGLPIPFSNLGSVVTDLFDYGGGNNNNQHQIAGLYRQLMTLHLNAQQVYHYTKEYAKLSSDLPHEKLAQLNDFFHQTEQKLIEEMNTSRQNSLGVQERLENLREAYENYLSEVKMMCRSVWAQFDLRSMFLGGFLYCSALLASVLFVFNGYHATELSPLAATFLKASLCLMVFVVSLHLNILNEAVSCIVIFVAVGFVFRKTKLNELTNLLSKCKASFLDCAALLSCLVYFLSLFSNSYVVYEDTVTTFLFQTLVILLCVAMVVNVFKKTTNPESKHGRHVKVDSSFLFITLFQMICVLVGVRLSQHFRACREEQWTCETSMFLQPLSAFSKNSSIYMNFRLLFSMFGVSAMIYGTYRWMRFCGNLNGSAVAVVMMSYVIPFSGLMLAFYWLVLGLGQNVPNFMIPPGFFLAPPRFVYIISLVVMAVVFVRPLCLFLVMRKNENDARQEMMLSSVSGEVNIIPQIYNHLKLNYKQNSKISKDTSNSDSQPPVVVYGLATVYSSSHLVLLLSVVMVTLLLLGDGVAPSVFLLWFMLFALLELCASYVRIDIHNDEVHVPWINVVIVFFLASEHFFSTGHQATITSIRWEAGFHGFSGDFSSNIIPALLVMINTLSSQLICTIALPLFTYWRYTRGHWVMTKGKGEKEENRGELILNEDKNLLRQTLFNLYAKYILLHGLKMLATMLCVAIHRRHLMVWKIFAPRFVFEGATFIMVSIISVLTCLFVLRVDHCVDNWIKKIDK